MTRSSLVLLVVAGCGSGSSSSLHIAISANDGTNVAPAPLDFAVVTGARDLGVGIFQFDAQDELGPDRRRLVIVGLQESANTPLVAGRSFVVDDVSVEAVGHGSLTLTDVEGPAMLASWQGTAGRVTVRSVDGERVGLQLDGTMTPAQSPSAAGTFQLAGAVSVDQVADTHVLPGNP